MSDSRLETFVHDALAAGASRAEAEKVLLESGWPVDQVKSALSSYAAVDFAVPVPRPRTQLSARDAFLYLVMFGMLYFSAYHFGNLLFQFINMAIPDPLDADPEWAVGRIRWSTSVVLVTFPVFIYTAWRIAGSFRKDPFQRTSAVRKWLTYMTLALAACIIVGDVVVLLHSLLTGELTARFLLKAVTVALISGGIFTYYLTWMRADDAALDTPQ